MVRVEAITVIVMRLRRVEITTLTLLDQIVFLGLHELVVWHGVIAIRFHKQLARIERAREHTAQIVLTSVPQCVTTSVVS
jgi:hypothetical protein